MLDSTSWGQGRLAIGYADVLILMRLASFVRARWPQRSYRYDGHWPGSLDVTRYVYFRWVTFTDGEAPQAVGFGLDEADTSDPLFEVIECHTATQTRTSLWRYGAEGWRAALRPAQAKEPSGWLAQGSVVPGEP